MSKRLISVVIPAYNEEACLQELASRLTAVMDANDNFGWEVIVVENGSSDSSWSVLGEICRGDDRFRAIQLSRNFRADGGITAGLTHASGDACVIMMADLQEPPELIPQLIEKWQQGFENVYGLVTRRGGTGPVRRLNSRIFYWLAKKLTGETITPNASDFRLVDRKVYEAVLSLNESNRFVRGLFSWVGFSSIGVPFEREARFGGVSNAPTLKVLQLAINGILAHTVVPLRLITFTGFVSAILAMAVLGWFSYMFIFNGVPFDGFGTIVGLNLLGFSILTLALGVIGEYLGLNYEESKNRPHFIVRDSMGLD